MHSKGSIFINILLTYLEYNAQQKNKDKKVPIEQIKDIVDYGVIGLLIFLSFITFAFAIERILFYRSIKLTDYSNKTALELDISKRLPTIASLYCGLFFDISL